MELTNKQKVLLAIYIEYQKDAPDMDKNIKSNILGMPYNEFNIALDKLESEGLIKGTDFSRAGNRIFISYVNNTKITPDGEKYVREKVGLSDILTGKEKIKHISKKIASAGWEQAKDIIARTLAEINKQ
ncbi:YjcQ family protein [Clostridium tyrobutyricum]|uniref:YjcQ family protein n=1 Tax=Clostridium tyrobutyricum TaxID=1519 RepID=UPI001C38CA39|nr:YjcQ family protein [Clostridium tyrobutyricum]MBV4441138.1 YjcQ family protein [Clostridium tyrobutyricum]